MISTHILDTTLGRPASQVSVHLEVQLSGAWQTLEKLETNADGRAVFQKAKDAGLYRLRFGTIEYFQKLGQEAFFQDAEVSFRISDTQRKYHVPLLLNPFAYSTYRGS